MSNVKQDWPTVSISEDDQSLVRKFAGPGGLLEDADTKDVLMTAAAMAVELGLPDLPEEGKKATKKVDIIHQNLLRGDGYDEYRQYMLLIYYLTVGQQDLRKMDNFKDVTANFVNMAHRGLGYLNREYATTPDGNRRIEELFGEYLKNRKKTS